MKATRSSHGIAAAMLAIALLSVSGGAEAKGCVKGAAVGAVAGHVAGHHALLGAAAGCAIGHHLAKKRRQEQKRQSQAPRAPGQSS